MSDSKMSTKKNLPAKYAKPVVHTFWVLNQLKNMNIIQDVQFLELCNHFHLLDLSTNEQIKHYEDLVENFADHENNLKSFSKSKNDGDSFSKEGGGGGGRKRKLQNSQTHAQKGGEEHDEDILAKILGLNTIITTTTSSS